MTRGMIHKSGMNFVRIGLPPIGDSDFRVQVAAEGKRVL